MTYFLLLGTNQFAVVIDNRVQCCDNRKDNNILISTAIKTKTRLIKKPRTWTADGHDAITNKCQQILGR